MNDEFEDLEHITESSLKKVWLNKSDEIWNNYLIEKSDKTKAKKKNTKK